MSYFDEKRKRNCAIAQKRAEGASLRDLSNEFGLSISRLIHLGYCRARVARRENRWRVYNRAVPMLIRGMSRLKVAAALGTSPKTLRRSLREFGGNGQW